MKRRSLQKFLMGTLWLVLASLVHGEEAELRSEVIGGHGQLIGVWDLDRMRETQTTPVHNVAVLTVIEQVGPNRYRVRTESKSEQYMAEGQTVWKRGRCKGGAFSRKKKMNPCRWESESRGVLRINGSDVTIAYENPSYAPDTLTLRGTVMEGHDRNGPISYIKRAE